MTAEPSSKGANFHASAKASGLDVLELDVLIAEENKIVALGRRKRLRDFQQVERHRQRHFGEAANLEAADAEEAGGSELFAKQTEGVVFALDSTGENEEQVGGTGRVSGREPSSEARPEKPGRDADCHGPLQ
jgi:hypothetical protein